MIKKYICGCLVLLLLFCDLSLIARPAAAATSNVALNKTVTVSSEYKEWESSKEHLVDGKADTHWSAQAGVTTEKPEWVMIDLGEMYNLSGADIKWREDTVVQYLVETSADQQQWTTVANQRNNTNSQQIANLTFKQNDVRYIRLQLFFYKEAGAWPQILEFNVWGESEGMDPADIVNYNPVQVNTFPRNAPVLPTEVEANYINGKSGMVSVTWDHIMESQYEKTGEFSVTGSVYGTVNRPEAKVIVQGYRSDYVRGVDISTLTAIEDKGGKYIDRNGTERDLLDILKDRGVNYVRLRLWNDPQKSGGYNDKADVIRMAVRAKQKGYKVLLDFHYSDEWAHPGQQLRPKAWETLNFEELKKAVYDYTVEVVGDMKKAGAMPDMVQIGNEINSGLLNGLSSDVNFKENAALLKQGIAGVRAVEGNNINEADRAKIMIHLAEGGKVETFKWYFEKLKEEGLHSDYDIIGLSYYPFWHGTFADVQRTMNEVSDMFGKDVIIAETSYPFTYKNGDAHGNIIGSDQALLTGGATFPATVQGQHDAIAGIMDMIANVPNHRGAGFFYWEPAWIPAGVGWIASEGDAWENQGMFDYDEFPANGGHSYEGRALPSLDVYKRGMEQMPADRQHLAAALTRARSLVESDFTSETWGALEPAIQAAESVYAQAYTPVGVTQDTTNAATASLESVMSQLGVIKPNLEDLEAAIEKAKAYQQKDWSSATWTTFSKALEHAKGVITDPRATQTDAIKAVERLEAAARALSDVDKTQLHQYIQLMQQENASAYTRRSWTILQQALQEAIRVRDNGAALQSEVNSALDTLKQTFTDLVKLEALTTGKTATSSTSAGNGGGKDNSPGGAIDDNPNTSWGTDQGPGDSTWWTVDLGRIANLRKIEMSMWSGGIKYKIDTSTDNEHFKTVVDTTSDVVVSTSPSHVLPEGTEARYIRVTIKTGPTWVGFMEFEAYGTFPADKTQLKSTVDSAEALQQADYTASSWSAFNNVLIQAQQLVQDVEATIQDLSSVDQKLKEAIAQLVRQTTNPGTGQSSQPGHSSGPASPSTSTNNAVTPTQPSPDHETASGSIRVKGTATGDGYMVRPSTADLAEALKSMDSEKRTLKLIADVPDNSKAVTFQVSASQLSSWIRSEKVLFVDLVVGKTTIRISLRSLPLTIADSADTLDVVVAQGSAERVSAEQRSSMANHSVVQVDMLLNNKSFPWGDRAIEVVLSDIEPVTTADTVMVVNLISTSGELQPVIYSKYDQATATMVFKPSQLGSYVIINTEVPLTDLQRHAWAVREVQSLYSKGIISGMSGTRFDPHGELTRAQFLQMIVKVIGKVNQTHPSAELPTDVKSNQWYAEAVRTGLAMNIVQGRADGTFGANDRISREEMALMLYRAMQLANHESNSATVNDNQLQFKDQAEIANYALEAVTFMMQRGVLNGLPDNTFAPKQTANRAQGAVAIARLLEQLY
ncbi:MAG: glycosyl hydrolase 53 family protein [Paenibacillus sp.]|uniref:glycosyl hydrolase 53 family protein n=1 Tax=Paenibacillus sp. TaxID=58172 RepID=UPI0025F48D64|nr:glycosyl hydrolase 53 family protein [Paenibacillus sp.]MBR2563298.1 glycosyl hydrolase 53 family protein [Paenibacillus sp.]